MSPMAAGGPVGGIGGDPSVVEGGAEGVADAAKSITATGQQVRSHGDSLVNGWVGSTSDAAHEVLRWLSERTDVGGDVVGRLPKILDDDASELRAAQEAYATAVAQAVTARAALSNVRALEAESGFVATTPVRPEAFGSAPPSALEAGAIEDVDAASDAIAAAIAREQLANRTAARGVNALTAELSGMTLDVVEAQSAAVTAQQREVGGRRPLTGIEQTATHVTNALGGALATGYIAVQGPEYLMYRAAGWDHDGAMAELRRQYAWIADASPVDTESAVYRFFDLHDNFDEAAAGTPGGGAREVGAATGSVAWDASPIGVTSAVGHASSDTGPQAAAWAVDETKHRLEEFGGADTESRVYKSTELAGDIVTFVGPAAALRGPLAATRAARTAELLRTDTDLHTRLSNEIVSVLNATPDGEHYGAYLTAMRDIRLTDREVEFPLPTQITALDDGPLNATARDSFRGGTYTVRPTGEEMFLYRVYSSNKALGFYWTPVKPAGSMQSIVDSALRPEWGNEATKWVEIKVPRGTVIYEGPTEVQGAIPGGGP